MPCLPAGMYCPDRLLECLLLWCRYQAEKRAAQEHYKAIGALLDEQCAANAEQHAEEAAQVGTLRSCLAHCLTAGFLGRHGQVTAALPTGLGKAARVPQSSGHLCWTLGGERALTYQIDARWPVCPWTQDAAGLVS